MESLLSDEDTGHVTRTYLSGLRCGVHLWRRWAGKDHGGRLPRGKGGLENQQEKSKRKDEVGVMTGKSKVSVESGIVGKINKP